MSTNGVREGLAASNSLQSCGEAGAPGLGVIGGGRRMLRVLELLARELPGLRVTSWYDPAPGALTTARARLGAVLEGVVESDSVEAVVTRPDVAWVFIGSWNCFHAAQVVAAFHAGKNVFCEKPLALSFDEAEVMHEAWRSSGRVFALGLVLRYSPLYRLARRLIDEGRIGRLLSFEFNETLVFNHGAYVHGSWRRHTAHAGSHLLEKCCHDLDLAMWLAGDRPVRVASFGGRTFFTPENRFHQDRIGPSPEGKIAYQAWEGAGPQNPFEAGQDIVDHQVAVLEFANGVRASFHTHCQAALPERRFYLIGTEGTMRLDAYTGRIELRRVGWAEPTEVHQPIAGDGHAGADGPMARELAACLAGHRAPAAGFPEGMASLALAEALETAREEGRVVDLRAWWERVDRRETC